MRNILLGVTASIAVVKVPELIQLLKRQELSLEIVMTEGATKLISPLSLQAFNKNPIRTGLFDAASATSAMGHIEFARWADAILIAPATADVLAKLAHGFADDLLSTSCLVSEAPLFIVPAMNTKMWEHPATQHNVALLKQRGATFLGPDDGEMACGEVGMGRMLAPSEIVQRFVSHASKPLKGKHLLITAGPTREAIDPVRFLSNHSSGKMGVALVQSALELGATVTVVAGPLAVALPKAATHIAVESAEQMLEAVLAHLPNTDMFISAAAVADYKVAHPQTQKIKKNADTMTLTLEKNPDILQRVASHPNRPPLCIGFAAETENLIENAMKKLQHKGLDAIIANQVGDGLCFHEDENACTLVFNSKETLSFTRQPKTILARHVLQTLAERFYA